MFTLSTPAAPTNLEFLSGTGFNSFEVVEADLIFELGRTTLRATVMFDLPVHAWAYLDFTIESRQAWRRRVGTREFGKFVAALGLHAVNDAEDLVGRRGAVHVPEQGGPTFARLAA